MRWLGLVVVLFVADVRIAGACGVAPPPGARVAIAEEEALIIWDPATKTEHFIRRAAFHSTARQFGFLVPTPSKPELSEVDDSIFDTLADLIRPPVRYVEDPHYEAGSWCIEACMLGGAKSAKDDAPAPVRVIATAHVAGFDATTVEADDAGALAGWLGTHGFAATPQLTAWLQRYVDNKWTITAFVIASDERAEHYEVATKSVKMTFPTERPFYPYREPELDMTVEANVKMAPENRLLRVFFFGDERHAATLANEPWSAKVLQANKRANLSGDLAKLAGAHTYMTVFVDESSPRRGIEELYFAPSADRSDVTQPTQIVKVASPRTIPIDFIVLVSVVIAVVVYRKKRRR
jgi:hypothetical protein